MAFICTKSFKMELRYTFKAGSIVLDETTYLR